MSAPDNTTETTEAPWYAIYPDPKSKPGALKREEVLQMIQCQNENPGSKTFLLVDVRRNDFEGGTISGSINLPAQSLYPTLSSVYHLLKAAGVKNVIFYCGSSRGRGSRAAGWLADFIAGQGDQEMQSLILEGGMKGWVTSGSEYVGCVVGYVESAWSNLP